MINDLPQHVMLCRDSLVGVGGAERVLFEQSEALIYKGIKCTVVLFEANDDLLENFHKDVNIIVLGQKRYDDIIFIKNALKLRNAIKKANPDYIIALQSLSDYLRIALSGTKKRYILYKYTSLFYLANDTMKYSLIYKKVFNKVHQSLKSYTETIKPKWNASIKHRLLNEYFAFRDWLGTRGAEFVLTLTSKSKWELEQLYKIKPMIWTPGSNFTNLKKKKLIEIKELRNYYGVSKNEKIILSVNRLEYRKRVGLSIDGFYLYNKTNPESKLIIVGTGEEEQLLRDTVKNYDLNHAVIFAGLVTEESLVNHYYMADICVSMIWGSWALSVIEPLFFNKPQIISDEVPDLLDGVPNLYKVSPTPMGVARGIGKAIRNDVKNSASVIIERYNWNKVTDDMLQYIGYYNHR